MVHPKTELQFINKEIGYWRSSYSMYSRRNHLLGVGSRIYPDRTTILGAPCFRKYLEFGQRYFGRQKNDGSIKNIYYNGHWQGQQLLSAVHCQSLDILF